ncbi:hypothetical protein [Streptomyces sp. NPDC014734]|uniref:hypothetical protein n=1 Tax=Streptomyces sp. NPDC014734 TaxID=3364886 RepID=UPI0036F74242
MSGGPSTGTPLTAHHVQFDARVEFVEVARRRDRAVPEREQPPQVHAHPGSGPVGHRHGDRERRQPSDTGAFEDVVLSQRGEDTTGPRTDSSSRNRTPELPSSNPDHDDGASAPGGVIAPVPVTGT